MFLEMRNIMSKELAKIHNQKRDRFIKDNVLTDKNLDLFTENILPFETLMSYYRCAIMEVETKFKVLNEQFSLRYDNNPIETIKSRVKSIDSILKKVKKKDIPLTFEALENEIYDIAGVRVICSFVEDVYLIADCFLKQDDITLLAIKDYIKNPKPSGYRSLHLIIEIPIFLENEKRMMKVEVQLRTLAMDLWASQEHKLRYKKKIPDEQQEYLQKELNQVAKTLSEIDAHMEKLNKHIHNHQYHEEVQESKKNIQKLKPVFIQ